MKRSLYVAFLFMGLALAALPLAWKTVDREKEDIVIREEILSGDPSAAEGVTLRIASYWSGHLLWDTEYTIGSGNEAESKFRFSAKEVDWMWEGKKSAKADFLCGASFGTVFTEGGYLINPQDLPYPEIIQAVTDRTAAGETHNETICIRDYYKYFPVSFEIAGSSVEYVGDYDENLAYLAELFRIPSSGDRMEVTAEKDEAGNNVFIKALKVTDSQSVMIADASAFGESGCYYAFCLESVGTGQQACRGENCGIFYLPFAGEKGWIRADLSQMRKLCPLPEGAVPVAMLLGEEKERLYLAVKETADYVLLVYGLEDGIPVLEQSIALGQEQFFNPEAPLEEVLKLGDEQTEVEVEIQAPRLRDMVMEDGGLLVTWSDNHFSFVTEESGQYRLWCSGRFPDNQEPEYVSAPSGIWARNTLFPGERECLFDGERLILAAFEGWRSLNVLLAVYDESGEIYAGLYRYEGEKDDLSYGVYRYKRMPQGRDSFAFTEGHYAGDAYVEGTGEPVRPMELAGEAP